jgi:hypothetical protein
MLGLRIIGTIPPLPPVCPNGVNRDKFLFFTFDHSIIYSQFLATINFVGC